jgi:hypothetical protein
LQHVRNLLELERQSAVTFAGDEPHLHTYQDKFSLAEFLTNITIAVIINVLVASTTAFDLQPQQQQQILAWVHGTSVESLSDPSVTDKTMQPQTVTLRFIAEDTCTLFKEEEQMMVQDGDAETVTTHTTKTTNNGMLFGTKEKKREDTTSTKVILRVKEYHWKVGLRYKVIVFPGTSVEQAIVLQQRTTEAILVTQAGSPHPRTGAKVKPPLPERTIHPPVDTTCFTWLFRMIDPMQQTSAFTIDRNLVHCKTPRRNDDIQAALDCFRQLHEWSRITQGFFLQRIEKEISQKDNPVHPPPAPLPKSTSSPLEPGATGTMQGLIKEPTFNGKRIRIVEYYPDQQRYKAEPVHPSDGLPATLSIKPNNFKPDEDDTVAVGPPLHSITDDEIFIPILPLMENGSVLSITDIGNILQEQSRTIENAFHNLARVYPSKEVMKLITISEASMVLVCKHMERLIEQYQNSVEYVEDMLKQQLIAAIGKEIQPNDFEQYMKYYYPKLYAPNFAPVPFSHPIRRPGHYPDGILSIESIPTSRNILDRSNNQNVNVQNEPIQTWVRSISGKDAPSIYVPIDAAVSVEISGDRFVHGWMQHRFAARSPVVPKMPYSRPVDPQLAEYQLTCRARQFSSFLLILGTMSGPNTFDPKEAIVIQNKDEVLIPLMTTVLPSAKEFKDAIKSLSPEQQDFARAFRSMQLESSVFGICVIQIKPQLEKLLGLPADGLTKEIQLTQDIMALFVEYQVPSDLMTFDGDPGASNAEKVSVVRGHVDAVLKVIDDSKKRQLKEEEMRADMRAEMAYSSTRVELLSDSDVLGGEGAPQSGRRSVARMSPPGSMEMHMAMTVPFNSVAMEVGAAASPNARQRQNVDSQMRRKLKKEVAPPSNAAATVANHVPSCNLESQKMPLMPSVSGGEDFTMIPKTLDTKLEQHDTDSSLHSTIIKPGRNWLRTRQLNFLTKPQTTSLPSDEILTEKKQAVALLDAISRSGTLPVDCSELHVFIAVSHCFDNDVMGSVVQDNVNPIVKVERSSLLLASTIFQQAIPTLMGNENDVERLTSAFPSLMSGATEAE